MDHLCLALFDCRWLFLSIEVKVLSITMYFYKNGRQNDKYLYLFLENNTTFSRRIETVNDQ